MLTDALAPRSRSTAGRGLLVVGWVAVLLPVIYMSIVGWDSGEHGGTVILFGLFATAFQLVVWGSVWLGTRNQFDTRRRVAFGTGATIGLVASLAALALTGRPIWAGATYLVIASLTAMVARTKVSRRAKRSEARS